MFGDGLIPLLKVPSLPTSALTLHKNLLRHIYLVGIFNEEKGEGPGRGLLLILCNIVLNRSQN